MPSDWTRVRSLFEEAAELAPAERREFLDRECALDTALREEVEVLLRADAEDRQSGSEAGDPLSPEGIAEFVKRGVSRTLAGTAIGPYRLVRALGTGGMGTVYEAVQEQPRRTVAVKVLNLGLVAPEKLRRFEVEAETLGRLRHPAIAQVYESGVATLGGSALRVPYFAMELVEGSRDLLDHVLDRGLLMEARLELFLEVASAVQHAHERGVIHRDLKPGNLLVDPEGRPKVIDFGIARSVGETSDLTRTGHVLGTLSAMAPEQLEGGVEIDARADVYALGTVLYQLVTGLPAFQLAGLPLPEAARIVREVSPRAPSRIARTTPRELDWILARALEKERELRYPSAAALAEDVRRLLDHEPVLAGPPSAAYRARKFVRRHRTAVGALGAVLVALVLGLAFTVWGLDRAVRAEGDAQDQFQRARARSDELEHLNEFLVGLLTSPAAAAHGYDVRVVEILDEARASLDTDFGDRPSLALSQRLTLADAYAAIGSWADSLAEAERSLPLLAILEERGRPDPARSAHARTAQLYALIELGRANEAAALAQGLLDEPWVAESERLEVLRLLHGQALLAEGHHAEAELELRAALHAFEQGARADLSRAASAHSSLATLLRTTGRLTEALEHARRSLALREERHGPDSGSLLIPSMDVALVLIDRGEPERAVTTIEDTLAVHAERFGPAHPWVLEARSNLAGALLECGRTDEALRLLEETLLDARETLGPEHLKVLALERALGSTLYKRGELAAAEEHYRRGLELSRSVRGEGHADTLRFLRGLLGLLQRQGRLAEAEELLRRTHEEAEDELGAGALATLSYARVRAVDLHSAGRGDEAEPLYRAVLDGALALLEAFDSPELNGDMAIETGSRADLAYLAQSTANDLGYLLHQRGELDEAEELYLLSIELGRESAGPYAPTVLASLQNLALLRHGRGDGEDAARELERAHAASAEQYGPLSTQAALCLQERAQYLVAVERSERAATLYLDVLPPPSADAVEALHVADLRVVLADMLAQQGREELAAQHLAAAAAVHSALRGPAADSTLYLERRLGSLPVGSGSE